MSFEPKKPLTCADVLESFGFITAVIVIISVVMLIGEAMIGISRKSSEKQKEKEQREQFIEIQKAFIDAYTLDAITRIIERQKDGL